MHAECLVDWNRIALSWDLFESRGLTPALIQSHVGSLRPPIGVIGCGRGLILEQIRAVHRAADITGFDASSEMIKAARERGHDNVLLVSASEPLPRDFSAGAVVIATGVIDPLEPAELQALLRRVRACLRPDGAVLLTAFCQRNAMAELVQAAGAQHPLGVAWIPVIDWTLANPGDPKAARVIAWLEAIAHSRSCNRAEAAEWLKGVLPRVRRQFDTTELAAQVHAAGFSVVSAQEHADADVLVIHATPNNSPEHEPVTQKR